MTSMNDFRKILISPTTFGECGPEPLALLQQHGLSIVQNTLGRRLTEAEVIELGLDCIGMIAGVEPLNSHVLEHLPQLKCIVRCGVGMENVDLQAAERMGITVRNTPDGPTRAVAEFTLGLMLSLLRKIPQANENFHKGLWKKETGLLLHQKTVGIVGLGRIGRMVTDLLEPFGCRLIGYDPFPDQAWLKAHSISLCSFEQLLKDSDLITLHAAHPADAAPLLAVKEFKWIHQGAWILNLSRGNLIDESALYESLLSGHLAGAALDVFTQEPYQGPFTKLPNVIGTPHLGSYAKEAKLAMEIESVRQLIDVLK
jgi:D-3-phosphoglycerate dehydrogenase